MTDQLTTAEQAYQKWRQGEFIAPTAAVKLAWFDGYDVGYQQGLAAATTDLLKGEKGGANAKSD